MSCLASCSNSDKRHDTSTCAGPHDNLSLSCTNGWTFCTLVNTVPAYNFSKKKNLFGIISASFDFPHFTEHHTFLFFFSPIIMQPVMQWSTGNESSSPFMSRSLNHFHNHFQWFINSFCSPIVVTWTVLQSTCCANKNKTLNIRHVDISMTSQHWCWRTLPNITTFYCWFR